MLTRNSSIMPPACDPAVPAPWSLFSWPSVFCQANAGSALGLVHLGTRITHRGTANTPPSGQTLWGQRTKGSPPAGLAWDWVEIGNGVVTMVDPMCVVTNLLLLSEAGEVLTAYQSAMHLNRLVRDLPWQDEVWRLLRSA